MTRQDDHEEATAIGQPDRRRVLKTIGALGVAGIAGCGSDGNGTPSESSPVGGTSTPTGTATDSPGGSATETPANTETGTDTPGQPLPEEPSSLITTEGGSLQPGGTATLTGTLANPYFFPVRSVDVSFRTPTDAWTVSVPGESGFDSIDPQATREVTWEVTPPEDAEGEFTLDGTVSYETTTDAAEVGFSYTGVVFSGGAEGLAAHWSLDSGTIADGTVTDVSGNGNAGTVRGDPGTSDGTVGDAIDLDGEGDVIQVTHDASLQVQTDDFTLAAWVNTGSTTDQQGVISKKTDDGVSDDQLAYQITLGGYAGFGGSGTPLDPTFAYNDGSGLVASSAGQAVSTD